MIDLAGIAGPEIWGSGIGLTLASKLLSISKDRVIEIDLTGITRIDVPGARAGLVDLARAIRPWRDICLNNARDIDIIDNIEGAALARGTPLILWQEGAARILGPLPSPGLQETFNYLLNNDEVTTNELSESLSLKVSNASNKLKTLFQGGYILRQEYSSNSGGIEYVYQVAKPGGRKP